MIRGGFKITKGIPGGYVVKDANGRESRADAHKAHTLTNCHNIAKL